MTKSSERYGERLQRSFASVYAALEMPRTARRVVVGLLIAHSASLAYLAYVSGPTQNEPGHLVAGLSIWKFQRFDVYSVNPPLVKLVASIPVIAAGYKENWTGFSCGPGDRPEMKMGEDFIAANGERSFYLFMIARWACIPFSWIGALVCYLWARDLFGRPAGVLACAIWCVEPNIAAHASLITPDATATSLGVAACYAFWRWLRHSTWLQAILAGIILGVAELAKTTLLLFYPVFPLLWLTYRLLDRRNRGLDEWTREAAMLLSCLAMGVYMINFAYGFDGSCLPLREYRFVSNLFSGTAEVGAEPNVVPNDREDVSLASPPDSIKQDKINPTNRFADAWLGFLPIPFPKQYLIGIDLQQRDFEHYGRPSYLHGKLHQGGWWYYYIYAVAIKTPLGFLIFSGLTLVMRLRNQWTKRRTSFPADLRRQHFYEFPELILLFPPLIIFTVVSSKTGFSEHMRYVLPCFPFLFITSASLVRNLQRNQSCLVDGCTSHSLGFGRQSHPLGVYSQFLIFPALFVWFFASSLWIYPHSLSYYNELIGGPLNGPKHLLGSNTSWGQDVPYFLRWCRIEVESNPHVRIYAEFDCDYGLDEIGLNTTMPFPSASMSPHVSGASIAAAAAEGATELRELPAGWYATTVNRYYENLAATHEDSIGSPGTSNEVYLALQKKSPPLMLGYSIMVFLIPSHQ